ncbi:MAG: response regulator [Chloroflexi bacterium]|nr:response regulator [Chloroflexota bacterium]
MSKKILIVEDEADIRAALSAWFEGEGFEIAEADNGIAGLAEFERTQPDIALLDMNMPGMTGVELCTEIRKFSRTPLVMFTADADANEVQTAIVEGATDWVLKQGGFDALIDRITAHLSVERQSTSVAELGEAASAHVLAASSQHVDGVEHFVPVDPDGLVASESPSDDDLWTWGGEYFGFRDGADLWTFEGKHVGRIRRGTEIYRTDGRYMGDVVDGRLIVDWHKTARRASSFTPSGDRSVNRTFGDREPFDMQIGFKDFPSVRKLIQ